MMQDGVTATNPQTGEKVVLRGGQWVPAGQSAPAPVAAPAAPTRIYGAPKPVDPIDARRLQLAEEDAARQRAKAPADLANAQAEPDKVRFTHTEQLRDNYNNSPNVKRYNEALTGYMSGLTSEPTPAGDLNLIYGFAKLMDPNSVVREGEQAAVAGGDTIAGQWQAKLEKELLQQGGTFTPAYRKQLREEMRRRGAALNQQFIAERVRYKQIAERAGLDPLDVVGEHPGLRFQDQEEQALGVKARNYDYYGNPIEEPAPPSAPGAEPPAEGRGVMFRDEYNSIYSSLAPSEKAQIDAAKARGASQEELNTLALRMAQGMAPRFSPEVSSAIEAALRKPGATYESFMAEVGSLVSGQTFDRKNIEEVIAARKANPEQAGKIDYSAMDKAYEDKREQELYGTFLPQALEERKGAAVDAAVRGAADTGLFGFPDELAAAGNTLFNGGTMQENRQRERAIDEADRRLNPRSRFGGQIAGGILNPIGRGATSPGQLARAGALGGGLYGLGSGTDLQSRGTNALLGAGGGAIGGYAVGKGMNALAPVAQRLFNSPARQAARAEQEATRQNALRVIEAGEVEGVPVSRALLDPALENPVTGAQATLTGGPIVDRALRGTSDAIKGGVQRLGGEGEALVPPVAGSKIDGAASRFIQRSGQQAKRLYDRADELSEGVRVTPQQSLQEVDGLIARLSETKNMNAAELTFLNSLKGDLQSDLSVSALRRIRTNLRKKISKGELVFGEDEARVLGIMDRASADINAGLQAAGRGEAARAFQVADDLYRKRMEFIQGTVQKLVGKRGANLSPEKVFANFQAMGSPKGDGAGFGRMMQLLDPDEASDIAATFAEALGRNNKGEFSTAHLLSQAEKLPQSVRRSLFGDEGAASLNNLLVLAKEHNRVSGKLNHSRSGVVAMASDYRSWLSGLMGISAAAATQDIRGMAVGGVAAGLSAGKDMLSAKALMSRDVSKWLRQAPRTSDPAAIDAHIRKLSSIAARNPQLAEGVAAIERRIAEGVALLPQRSTAQGQEPKKP